MSDSRDPAALRENIARTRARLAADLEALADRLNVAYAKERFVESIHEAKELVKEEAIEAKDELIAKATTAATLVVPLGLLGAGACWLIVRSMRDPIPLAPEASRPGPRREITPEVAREVAEHRRASTWSLGLVAVAAGLSLGLFLPPRRPRRPRSPG